MPHGEHMESGQLDKTVKRRSDDVWSLSTVMPCCLPPIVFHLFVERSKSIVHVLMYKFSPITVILSSFIQLLSS